MSTLKHSWEKLKKAQINGKYTMFMGSVFKKLILPPTNL